MRHMTVRVGALTGAAIASTAAAQVIHDNGPIVTGSVLSNGVPAPSGYVWSEVQAPNISPAVAVERCADNFTLAAEAQVDSVDVFAYITGAGTANSPFASVTLRIWRGRPGDADAAVVFGDTTVNRLAGSVCTKILRTRAAAAESTRVIWANRLTVGTTLPAGTYWLDWSSGGGQTPFVTIPGATQKPEGNGRVRVAGESFWRDAMDAGTSARQDFPFILYGKVSTPPSCYANCDGSTTAPILNVADFNCFLQKFAQGCDAPSPCYGNCDGSENAPFLNVADFNCYLQKFAAGCS